MQEFKNEEDDYEGPEILQLKNIRPSEDNNDNNNNDNNNNEYSNSNNNENSNIFIGFVKEYEIDHKIFSLEQIPKSVAALCSAFKEWQQQQQQQR